MLNKTSTPSSRWFEEGKPDPHNDQYSKDITDTAGGHYPHNDVLESLIQCSIVSQTVGKERLRWLSRRLVTLTPDKVLLESYNVHRATLLFGEHTDDELANAYYLDNTRKYYPAMKQRMKWLIELTKGDKPNATK
jgi:hypothetical protein